MATQPRLVNKQFNTPIGLYSQQNIQEVLQRDQQILANGAIGIDFHNPSVGKPSNLQNSAVLRMLEEEENRRGGRAGSADYSPKSVRDVSWPPPDYEQKNHIRSSFKDVVVPGVKRVAWPPPQEGILDPTEVVEHNAVQSQGGPRYSNQSPGLPQNNYSSEQAAPYQQPTQPSYRPLKPLDLSSVGTGSPLASPALNQSPQGFRSATPTKGWAPVQSPATTPLGSQKSFDAPAQVYQQQSQYQPVSQSYQQPNKGYQEPGRQYGYPAQPRQQPTYQEPGRQYGQPAQQYQYSQPTQQYQSPAQQYQQPSAYQQPPQQYQASSPQYQSPQPQYQSLQPQYQPAPHQYPQSQPSSQQYQSQSFAQPATPQNQASFQPVGAQPQAAPRYQPAKQEPPPSTITLRPTAPVSQTSAPVYSAQPATATLKVVVGGKHLRGDLKWPPENVKQRMADEQEQLKDLAKGPVNRPSRKEKDYSRFFAEHALNSTYPGYKIPPGTQFYRTE